MQVGIPCPVSQLTLLAVYNSHVKIKHWTSIVTSCFIPASSRRLRFICVGNSASRNLPVMLFTLFADTFQPPLTHFGIYLWIWAPQKLMEGGVSTHTICVSIQHLPFGCSCNHSRWQSWDEIDCWSRSCFSEAGNNIAVVQSSADCFASCDFILVFRNGMDQFDEPTSLTTCLKRWFYKQ